LLELFYHIEDVQKEGGDKPRPYKLTYQCRGGVYLRLMGWVVVKKSRTISKPKIPMTKTVRILIFGFV
jgi:hypothetical protein